MSNFRIHGLAARDFSDLAGLDDAALARRHIRRLQANSQPGYPCRVSLQDAAVGETVYLLSYPHLAVDSPYRASGPIFVRADAANVELAAGEIPPVLQNRLISLRAYDAGHLMLSADVCMGDALAPVLQALFTRPEVAYIQLHNARPGCFACEARRLLDDASAPAIATQPTADISIRP